MLLRSLFIAITVTLVTCLTLFIFLDIAQGFQLHTDTLPQTGIAVFLLSAVSAFVGGAIRSPAQPGTPGTTLLRTIKTQRESGNVKWFNASKGFGFITRDSGDDVFVHFRSIRGQGHRVLRDGQRVEFVVSQGEKGPQAEDVAVSH